MGVPTWPMVTVILTFVSRLQLSLRVESRLMEDNKGEVGAAAGNCSCSYLSDKGRQTH